MAGKNFKNVDKYWGIWYSVLYGMQEIRWINFNMGCFEIMLRFIKAPHTLQINFNMGCFEIQCTIIHCFCKVLINFNMGCFEIGQSDDQSY